MAVSQVTVVDGSSDSEARGRCPPGYTLVPVDLNEGAGGRWIYLCFAAASDADPVVVMAMSFSGHNTPQAHWLNGCTHVNLDLNKGAGGDYIYLNYLTSSAVSAMPSTAPLFQWPYTQWYLRGNPIIDIAARSSSSRPTTPTGYVRVAGYSAGLPHVTVDPDINRGAGGNYIYLYYKRSPALVSNTH